MGQRKTPKAISIHDIDEFIEWQQGLGRASATIRRRLIVLGMLFDYPAYIGLAIGDHLRDLKIFTLMLHTNLGISEVKSLLEKDVDLESRKLFIRNRKERKDRMVYISDMVVMALQQHLAIRLTPTAGYVFASTCGAITTRSVKRRLKYYGELCSVPVNARRLRHTFVSHMLASSMLVISLQRYMGPRAFGYHHDLCRGL